MNERKMMGFVMSDRKVVVLAQNPPFIFSDFPNL